MPPKIQSTGGCTALLPGVSLDKRLKPTYPRCVLLPNPFELTQMSDIFLSYVLDDLDKAERLRDAFRQQGWTVWWVPLAFYFDDPTEVLAADRELKDSKVIVALWSRRAARRVSVVRETLKRAMPVVPVMVRLDKARPSLPSLPGEFDLSDWEGAESHAGLQKLLRHLRALIDTWPFKSAPPARLDELSLSKIQEIAQCGIQESMGSRPEGGTRFIFISYRRSEAAAYAGRLYDRLAARFGKEKVFIDTENVGWGEDFVEAITSAAESCVVMIALVSPRWSRGAGEQEGLDDYVRLEVAKALGRKIRVIPILIQGASMPASKELPEDLAPLVRRNALALSDTRWERDVEDLMKTLESLLKD